MSASKTSMKLPAESASPPNASTTAQKKDSRFSCKGVRLTHYQPRPSHRRTLDRWAVLPPILYRVFQLLSLSVQILRPVICTDHHRGFRRRHLQRGILQYAKSPIIEFVKWRSLICDLAGNPWCDWTTIQWSESQLLSYLISILAEWECDDPSHRNPLQEEPQGLQFRPILLPRCPRTRLLRCEWYLEHNTSIWKTKSKQQKLKIHKRSKKWIFILCTFLHYVFLECA